MKKMIKHKMMTAALTLLAATWMGAACSGGDNAQTTSQDPQCEEVMVDGETYCVWKQSIIIETGYIPRCPTRLSYRYESDGLVMCSTRTTPPTKPIVFDIWRLAYNEAPPEEGDMGQVTPDADMGSSKDMSGRTCEQVKEDYAASHDGLPTSCQQDEDCEYVRVTGCGVTEGVQETCKAVATVTDAATRMTLAEEYSTLGCPSGPVCNICESQPVRCEQGQCVVSETRTCAMVAASYRAAVASDLDRSCAQNVDCKVVQPDCHMGGGEVGCTLAANVSADLGPLTALKQSYDDMACRANQANCVTCAPAEAVCNQGKCEAQPVSARTCDDIRAEYGAVYAAFPTTCQVAADCRDAGINSCGIASEVVDGCNVVVSSSADLSPLTSLSKEYQMLGCTAGDPLCNACSAGAVDCVQGQCVQMR